jgi:hypothetical protein
MRFVRTASAITGVLSVLAVSSIASAQEPGDPMAPAPLPAPPPPAPMTMPATTTAAPPPAAAAQTQSDHEQVVGRLGLGYMGQFDVPLGLNDRVQNQIIGARIWLQERFGFTAGLGFATSASSSSVGGLSSDGPSRFGTALKGGVLLGLASGKHYTFVIEPQLVVGFTSQTIKQQGQPDVSNAGLRLGLGATAGAEIQFGFIGIPELSLVGSVGLALDVARGSSTPSGGTETSASSTSFSTFSLANPWNIFAGNIAAIYYL